MPVTTRSARSSPQKVSGIDNSSTSEKVPQPLRNSMSTTTTRSGHGRPTAYLLFIYPLILLIGTFFRLLSPVAQPRHNEPLAAGITSDFNSPDYAQPNYFAGKRNIFNTLFVKQGWAWTTLAFCILQYTTRIPATPLTRTSKLTGNTTPNHYIQAAIRYGLLTSMWFLTTQWFFGPPLTDRTFSLTGGKCEGLPLEMQQDKLARIATSYSSRACKSAGGRWYGGHDISGHIFMLVLSSAALLFELYLSDRHSAHPNVSAKAAKEIAEDMSEEERKAIGGWETSQEANLRLYARYFLYAVVALDGLMMLTTSIWFHTWLEKVNGMILAGAGVWLVYFLGDYVPAWRQIVGGA